MPAINSPLGSQQFQGGMREFVVDDAETPQYAPQPPQYVMPQQSFQAPQQPQQFIQRQDIKRIDPNAPQPVSEGAKKRIEALCGMSRMTKEVVIDENIFVLRTLKTKENRDVLVAALPFDGKVEFSFELRKQILARSLISIANIDFEIFIGSTDFNAKLNFIDELDDAVNDRLYSEYLLLNKEIKEKYAIKTEKEIKEVAEDIKK